MPAIFYLTPIAYAPSVIPQKYLILVKLNPIYHFLGAFRSIIYYNESPSIRQIEIITVIAILFLGVGYFIFKKLERGFVSQY